jgi:hypothetical protein
MDNDPARYARDLLRIALDLLDDEESLTAVAMISGAIEVLECKTEPAAFRSHAGWDQMARGAANANGRRSCA